MNPEKFINNPIDAIMNTFFVQMESEDTIRPCENSQSHDNVECHQSGENLFLTHTNPINHDDI